MVEFLLVILVLALLVFPVWTIIRIASLSRENDALAQRLRDVDIELETLRRLVSPQTPSHRAPQPSAPATEPAQPSQGFAPRVEPAVARPAPPPIPPPPPRAIPPTMPATVSAATVSVAPATPLSTVPAVTSAHTGQDQDAEISPTLSTGSPSSYEREAVSTPSLFSSINWEQFTGAKLFAWIGGFTAFLGAVYFVRYSFEHDLIPPEVRVALGFLFGIALVVGGVCIKRERYAVTAQTLIASGIVSLYAVTFACNSIYHFPFFGAIASFTLMTLITATAFVLAVRLDAKVIAILGILGGFLTPVLLSTGRDNPPGLFSYLALLDVGLIAVALHRRWHFLVPLGAFGTVLMQIGWAGEYFTDQKAGIATVVCLGFSLIFLGACAVARRHDGSSPHLFWSAVAIACVCFGFALYFVSFAALRLRPGLLFSFVLAADLSLFGLAWIERRAALVALAALGAALVEVAWVMETLSPTHAPTVMLVCLIFCAVFLVAYFVARAQTRSQVAGEADIGNAPSGRAAPAIDAPREVAWSAAAMPFVAFAIAFAFLSQPLVASRPWSLLTFVLPADACLLSLAWFDSHMPRLHLLGGLAVFAVLGAWTMSALTASLLSWALGSYLLYAALHTAFPLLIERRRPETAPTWWSQLFPPLTLVLMLAPLFKLEAVTLLFWPCVLVVDVMAVVVALVSASLLAVAAVLVLTLGATAVWVFRIPVTLDAAPQLLVVIGGFAILFFAASAFIVRKLGASLEGQDDKALPVIGDTRAQLPAFSALLPFLLLIMITLRLPLANPSPVFGLALLLVVLTLGLAVIMTLPWLPACALFGAAAVEYSWHSQHFTPASAVTPLTWYVVFYGVFAMHPFAFRRRFAAATGPWAVAAAAGVIQFPLFYRLVMLSWPNHALGLLPAAFAVPPLLSLLAIVRTKPSDERARLNQLAWFGGVTLLFITLVFPIQFERQWLTLGWALEGAALLWLYHRVPHGGVRATGVVLLVVAFARLALNPAVLEYHARSETALLNWFLYSYGIVIAALFTGARLLARPRNLVFGVHTPPLLNTLGTVLAFLLLNIEIADYFSQPGTPVLTFQFSGNFARDMSYTIAWSLFALGLLLVSIARRLKPGRYAALALLGIAVLKLFLHDLARLDSLYRIAALFAVAIVAIAASVAYQRFLPSDDKTALPRK